MINAGVGRIPDDPDWAARNLPLREPQSCAFCGSQEWEWVYPLREQSRAAVTIGQFWCACFDCHRLLQIGDDAGLVTRRGPDDEDEPYSFAEDTLPVFHSSRTGEPLARADAQRR